MTEWSMVSVLKTDVSQETGGSNPSPSEVGLCSSGFALEKKR